jgi:hypothetical protein
MPARGCRPGRRAGPATGRTRWSAACRRRSTRRTSRSRPAGTATRGPCRRSAARRSRARGRPAAPAAGPASASRGAGAEAVAERDSSEGVSTPATANSSSGPHSLYGTSVGPVDDELAARREVGGHAHARLDEVPSRRRSPGCRPARCSRARAGAGRRRPLAGDDLLGVAAVALDRSGSAGARRGTRWRARAAARARRGRGRRGSADSAGARRRHVLGAQDVVLPAQRGGGVHAVGDAVDPSAGRPAGRGGAR